MKKTRMKYDEYAFAGGDAIPSAMVGIPVVDKGPIGPSGENLVWIRPALSEAFFGPDDAEGEPTFVYILGSQNYDGLRRINERVATSTIAIFAEYVAQTMDGTARVGFKSPFPHEFCGFKVHASASSDAPSNLDIMIYSAKGAASTGAASAVYTEKYDSGGVVNAGQRVAQGAGDAYIAGEFTNIAEEYTLRRIQLNMYSNAGGQDLTWTAEIREFAAGAPSDVVLATTTFTGNIPQSVPTVRDIDFDPGVVLEASTTYCVVIHRGGLFDGSDWIAVAYINTGTESILQNDDGLQPWDDEDTSALLYLKTYNLSGDTWDNLVFSQDMVGIADIHNMFKTPIPLAPNDRIDITWNKDTSTHWGIVLYVRKL